MAKHRAVIIGAGRIGAGYNWPPHPFVYTHADAYLKLKDRVELVGFSDLDRARADAAEAKYGLPCFADTSHAIAKLEPDIISVCVPPERQCEAFYDVTTWKDKIKGVWCEKPSMIVAEKVDPNLKIQVNYIRRFDTLHNSVKGELQAGTLGSPIVLVVMAKPGLETECHFTDLAKWWGVQLEYVPIVGAEYVNTEYELICTKGKVRFFQGGMSAQLYGMAESRWFPGAMVPHSSGQVAAKEPKIFMEVALSNLLDAVEGKAELKSPPY